MTLAETAYAKVNLALHVRSRRPDGYHEIESLFAFVDAGDVLTVEPASDLSLSVTGTFGGALANETDNLVLRAARALRAYFGVESGARITLDKRLPVAAGLGGGSADAAAIARLLSRLWNVHATEADLIAAIGALGADIPACVASRTCVGEGVGERLSDTPLAGVLSEAPILLVNPLVACSTGPVFKAWDGVDRGPFTADGTWRNDLTKGAIALVPQIADVLAALASMPAALQVAMSGSGATCLARFPVATDITGAAQAIRATHPDWWVMAGALR